MHDRRVERHDERKVLPEAEGHSAIQQANAARAHMHGVNSRPLPPGEVTRHGDGRMTVRAAGGRDLTLRPNGTLATFHRGETRAAFRPDGHIRELHRPNLDVMRGPRGERTVMVRRPDHSVVVTMGPHYGYVQRPLVYHGHEYMRRSYLVGGVRYHHYYAPYRYHGVSVVTYVPRYYYAPRYYGWVYYPWRRPAPYRWTWTSDPWYEYHRSYFVVSPVYAAPTFWLADFILAETLRASFQAQATVNVQAAPEEADPGEMVQAEQTTPITPELKQEIAAQVKEQLARENKAAQDPQHPDNLTGLEAVMVPGHVFVADTGLNIETVDELSCHVSPGTALRLEEVPAEGAAAELSVASSRQGDCPGGAHVTVSLEYLADMHNAFRAQLDGGMQTLRTQQGEVRPALRSPRRHRASTASEHGRVGRG